jgi:hypothetical protein
MTVTISKGSSPFFSVDRAKELVQARHRQLQDDLSRVPAL